MKRMGTGALSAPRRDSREIFVENAGPVWPCFRAGNRSGGGALSRKSDFPSRRLKVSQREAFVHDHYFPTPQSRRTSLPPVVRTRRLAVVRASLPAQAA